ncbi:MAG: glycosyltransferase [Cyanobacteria bacterium P01_H01_bin.15]
MRLLFPIKYQRHGGVERVIVSLLQELCEQVECLVVLLPVQKKDYFQRLLPDDAKIIFVTPQLSQQTPQSSLINWGYRLRKLLKQLQLNDFAQRLDARLEAYRYECIVNTLIEQYQISHCLYAINNRIPVPKVKVPLAAISYDLFWHFSPVSFPSEVIEDYDRYLLDWLQHSDRLISISEQNRQDVLKIFPEYPHKIISVPLSGFLSGSLPQLEMSPESSPVFYFPSSFAIYKDHLNLLNAIANLAVRGYRFKVILSGRFTDLLARADFPALVEKNGTEEYQNYLSKIKAIHHAHPNLFADYLDGLGYAELIDVEKAYARCNCVIFPSQFEGFGLAVSEAVVRGIPAVISDLPVLLEQVELYNCADLVRVFPAGNPEKLIEQMQGVLEQPVARLDEPTIQSRFGHWTWTAVAKQYLAQLDSLSQS